MLGFKAFTFNGKKTAAKALDATGRRCGFGRGKGSQG